MIAHPRLDVNSEFSRRNFRSFTRKFILHPHSHPGNIATNPKRNRDKCSVHFGICLRGTLPGPIQRKGTICLVKQSRKRRKCSIIGTNWSKTSTPHPRTSTLP